MHTLLHGRRQPRRVYLALLAALLVVFLTLVVATPSHAAAAAATPAIKGGSTRPSAVLDMRTVPKVLGANGTLQCVPDDYARATNRWTNAYGQTLAVGMYVGVNSACQVRFREHLVGSGSNGCNFDSDNATLWQSNGEPPGITKSGSEVMGHTNFPSRLNDGDCDYWYTGIWRTPTLFYVMSSDNAFHVHFLSPDHQGVNHAGCSQALNDFLTSKPNPCFYY